MDIRLDGVIGESELYKKRTRDVRARMRDWLDQTLDGLTIAFLNRTSYKFKWQDYAFNANQREALLHFLITNELIETYSKGFSFGDDAYKLTEMFPAKSLFDKIKIHQIPDTKTEIRSGKSSKKINDIDAKFLAKYVKGLESSLNIPLIDFKRIYTNTNEQGGRVYSAYQGMSAKNRTAMIRINDKPVTELDYRNNHLNILLACCGREVDKSIDLYSLMDDFYIERGIVKAAINATMNSTRPLQTLTSEFGSFHWEESLAKEFLSRFYVLFPELQKIKNGNVLGLTLQRFEGDVMIDIMKECSKRKMIVLPVHDSVICDFDHVDSVRDLMGSTWLRHVETYKERIIRFIK